MYSGEQIHAQIDVDFDTRVGVVRPNAAEAAMLLREARESKIYGVLRPLREQS